LEAFVGTILPTAFDYAPRGWLLCNGALLSINQYGALYSLLGTRYGGNGQTTFAVPNLQGRVPINQGQLLGGGTYPIGSAGGVENVTLLTQQMPLHTHLMTVDGVQGKTFNPTGAYFAETQDPNLDEPYNSFTTAPSRPTTLNPAAIQPAGGSQPHENRQPYLVINFIICNAGIFPSRQ
jgi:microcystin-dependent protein